MTRRQMRQGVMGKYYREVMAGSNLVRVAPDVQATFPNEQAVNQALRELLKMRERLISLTAGTATRKKSAQVTVPNGRDLPKLFETKESNERRKFQS